MKQVWKTIKGWLLLIGAIVLLSSVLWGRLLLAQLSYGDFTCAYKKCVVIKEEK